MVVPVDVSYYFFSLNKNILKKLTTENSVGKFSMIFLSNNKEKEKLKKKINPRRVKIKKKIQREKFEKKLLFGMIRVVVKNSINGPLITWIKD